MAAMLVEMLTFKVREDEREGWLAADHRTWTRFLKMQEGFVRKEIWVDATSPDRLHVAHWWESLEHRDAVPAAARRAVEQAMGQWQRSSSLHTFETVAPAEL